MKADFILLITEEYPEHSEVDYLIIILDKALKISKVGLFYENILLCFYYYPTLCHSLLLLKIFLSVMSQEHYLLSSLLILISSILHLNHKSLNIHNQANSTSPHLVPSYY